MAYTWQSSDRNVVDNIRFKYKDRVKDFSDVVIAEAWQVFSLSEDYGDDDKYLEWLKTLAIDVKQED